MIPYIDFNNYVLETNSLPDNLDISFHNIYASNFIYDSVVLDLRIANTVEFSLIDINLASIIHSQISEKDKLSALRERYTTLKLLDRIPRTRILSWEDDFNFLVRHLNMIRLLDLHLRVSQYQKIFHESANFKYRTNLRRSISTISINEQKHSIRNKIDTHFNLLQRIRALHCVARTVEKRLMHISDEPVLDSLPTSTRLVRYFYNFILESMSKPTLYAMLSFITILYIRTVRMLSCEMLALRILKHRPINPVVTAISSSAICSSNTAAARRKKRKAKKKLQGQDKDNKIVLAVELHNAYYRRASYI